MGLIGMPMTRGGGDPAKFHTQEFQLSRVHQLHGGSVYFAATAKRGEYYDENSKIPYFNSKYQETSKENWVSIYKRASIDTYDSATGKWVAGAFSREVQIQFVADKDGSVKLLGPQFGTCYTSSEEFPTVSGISGNQ
jgi:hypothetical protein